MGKRSFTINLDPLVEARLSVLSGKLLVSENVLVKQAIEEMINKVDFDKLLGVPEEVAENNKRVFADKKRQESNNA